MSEFQSLLDKIKQMPIDDTAYLARQAEIEAEQEAERKKAEIKAWEARGITPRYFNSTWENWIADTPEKQLALKTAKEAWNKNLLFTGKNGTGKTHLAMCLAKDGATYRTFTDICDEIISDFKNENENLNWYGNRKLLIIDEVGRQNITDFKLYTMFEIINRRWNNVLPTTIITNLESKELVGIYGNAIMDRLRPIEIKFNWESYRS